MKRVAKVIGVLVIVVVITFGGMIALSVHREARIYVVPEHRLEVPSDADALAEGERLYATRGCVDCHGARGEGKVVIDAPPGLFVGTNLGMIVPERSDAQLVAAIRHGIGPEGKALLLMPSAEYWALGYADVGRLIAFMRAMPQVSSSVSRSSLRPLGRVLHTLGLFPAISAERIDHAAERPAEVPVGPTVEYGRYLAESCTGCHGTGLSGGPIPGAPPELGVPTNLTPHASGLEGWTQEAFATAMRTGRTPSGRMLNAAQMPYPAYARLTDVELVALFSFLRSLPPRSAGQR